PDLRRINSAFAENIQAVPVSLFAAAQRSWCVKLATERTGWPTVRTDRKFKPPSQSIAQEAQEIDNHNVTFIELDPKKEPSNLARS
ncbi:hypothetical protein, partial [Undibacterium sp.]|uniref:hypothetical protein n=1 Tax=Undibacterium sp. TaxID=1914977 RepID=UPI00272C7F0F